MTAPRIIIADDLTGALDGAAAMTGGRPVEVQMDAAALNSASHGTVIALDTDSRYRAPDTAHRVVNEVTTRALEQGLPVYKKIDSMLRGNTVIEIAACFRAFAWHQPHAAALIAPAFPAAGRTTVDGHVRVDGKPLAREGLDFAAALRAAGLHVARLGLDTVRHGSAATADACRARTGGGAQAVVVDAVSDRDLDAVAGALESLGAGVLPVGSAGLLHAIAGRAGWPGPAQAPEHPTHGGPTLLVIGSYSGPARAQRDRLLESGVPGIYLSPPFGPDAQRTAADRLNRRLANGDALLCPDPEAPIAPSHAAAVAGALASTVSAALFDPARPRQPGRLIMTGGETARAILTAAGIQRLTVRGELEPGMVIATAAAPLEGVTLVTKAGAFGDAGTLARARWAGTDSLSAFRGHSHP